MNDIVLLRLIASELRAVNENLERMLAVAQADRMGVMTCPTCGPNATEPHPRERGVTRCANCKEWLTNDPR